MKENYVWIVAAALVPAVVMAQTGSEPDPAVGGYEIEIERSPGGQSATPAFRKVDTDSNGFIDRDEAKLVAGLQFADADEDRDGKLSHAEFEAAVNVRKQRTPTP